MTAGFWTSDRTRDPAMKYRFRVTIDGLALPEDQGGMGSPVVWYAKTVDKPKLNNPILGKDEYYLGSWLPDIHQGDLIDFQPITMTLVDPVEPHLAQSLMSMLNAASGGYGFPRLAGPSLADLFGTVRVEQLDAYGNMIEMFELLQPIPVSIDFGDLDYSDGSMTTVTIVWEYKNIRMSTPKLAVTTFTECTDSTGEYGPDIDVLKVRGFN